MEGVQLLEQPAPLSGVQVVHEVAGMPGAVFSTSMGSLGRFTRGR